MPKLARLAALLLLAACAGTPPAAPPAPTRDELLALDQVRAPTDPRYLELLEQARRDGAGITRERMIALRWAWVRSSDFNPVMPTAIARRALVRAGTDCGRAIAAAQAVLSIHWLDLRAHATLLACAERAGDAPAAALHGAVRGAILEAMRATGDGSGPERPLSTISVDEEYALLELMRARRTGLRLVARGGNRFDVMEATETEGGAMRVLWFDVGPLFEWYERNRPAAPART